MFKQKVNTFIKKNNLLQPRETVVVGVSGGVDSLALLHFLHEQSSKKGWKIIVAHVDHMFRGAESDCDYQFVQKQCEKLKLEFAGIHIDVPSRIVHTGKNPQQVARECRYHFFEQVMIDYQAHKLVLAHHLDDQAETMIMSMIRGTLQTAFGIPIKREFALGMIVRPFLAVSKQEIIKYSQKLGLEPREDASNAKMIYARNRIRHKIIPYVKEENEQTLKHFQQLHEHLQDDDDYLQACARKIFSELEFKKYKTVLSVPLQSLKMIAKPLQRRLIPLILEYLCELKPFLLSIVHLEMVLLLINNEETSSKIQIENGIFVVKSCNQVLFYNNHEEQQYEIVINVPGRTFLPNGDYIDTIEIEEFNEVDNIPTTSIIHITADQMPLKVRSRQDGDKVHIEGLNGHKKLKKIFLENKIPVHLRANWPIITNENEKIIWIPNLYQLTINKDTANFVLQLHTSTFFGGQKVGHSS